MVTSCSPRVGCFQLPSLLKAHWTISLVTDMLMIFYLLFAQFHVSHTP